MAWKKLCRPFDERGLGLRSLIKINEASNLKLCWNLLNYDEMWAVILRNRVLRDRRHIAHHVSSSIWSSVKSEYTTILENSTFLLGNGENIKFWTDSWCGPLLCEVFHIPLTFTTLLLLESVIIWMIFNGSYLGSFRYNFLISNKLLKTLWFLWSISKISWVDKL